MKGIDEMSGGSFNYVCYKLHGIEHLISNMTDFQDMITYCRDTGKSDIADTLQESYSAIESAIQQAQDTLNTEREKIYDLTRAIEWCVSGDVNEDAIDREYNKIKEANRNGR